MNRRVCGRVAGIVLGCAVVGLCVLLATGRAADAERAVVEPGLRVEFEAVEGGEARRGVREVRRGRVLGLAVGAGESATPFLPAGRFAARWAGYIEIDLRDRFVFEFEGRGTLELRIGGETVLAGGGEERGVWRGEAVRISGGLRPIEAVYRSPADGEATARVFWSSSRFAREAIPPGVLFHDADDAELAEAERVRAGRERLATGYCIRCHVPGEGEIESAAMPELGLDAPPLVGIADKLRPEWMARWVEDPRAIHPEARMPRMFHGEGAAADAADVAAYLATLTLPRERGRPRPHEAPEADERTLTEGARLYASLGCVSCHTLDAQPRVAGPHAPGAGGPHERLPLSHVGEKWQPRALRDYLLNPQGYYAWSRMPDFGLSGSEAEALAAFLLDQAKGAAGGADPVDLEWADVERGMRLVAGSGCVNCHAAPVPTELIAPSLGAMGEALRGPEWDRGCVAHDAAARGDAPDVHLDDAARGALRAFAAAGFDSLSRADPVEFAERQIESLRCMACHERDGEGDLWTEYEGEVAAWVGSAEREAGGEPPVDQSRPSLTYAGEMLRPDWVADLLAGRLDYKVRPWLRARMPGFGPARAGLLADGLARSHGVSPDEGYEEEPDAELAAAGARLVSGGLGFACTDCHAAGDRPAESVFEAEGVNFMYAAERLRPDYYHRWMMDPQRVTPGNRMPRYAEADGTTVLVDMFGGDAAAQFEAIRHYLLAGREISPPESPEVVAGAPDRTLPVELGGEFREEDYDDDRWERMEIGRLFSGSIRHPEAPGVAGGVTYKGVAIEVGDEGEAALTFDTDLLRVSVGWRGDFIRTDPTRYGLLNLPGIGGEPVFATHRRPGWADTGGRFDDPRERPYGPLPSEWGRYEGLYKHGDRIVLSYRVGEAAVLDSPWVEWAGGVTALTRTLEVGAAGEPGAAMSMIVAEADGAAARVKKVEGVELAVLEEGGGHLVAVGLIGDAGAALEAMGGELRVSIPARGDAARLKLLIWSGEADDLPRFAELVRESEAPEGLERLTEPGPTRWGDPLVTRGQLGREDGPWAVDTLTVPYDNPFDALMFTSGHGFLPNGDIAVSTAHGDVWIVGGIDDALEELTWTRFATGLFQPLGVRVVNGKVHVLGRDQITILHDRNGNGEADFYENFSNLVEVDDSGHAYHASLHTDAEGNFYFTRGSGGGRTAHEGALLRTSADGREIDVVATGFRYPNGMSVGPDGTITVADQDGEWVPSTRIDRIEEGGFYGFMPSHHRESPPEGFDGPMAWVPHGVDNSAGGQVWVEGDRWGLAEGSLVHLSFGRCAAFLVLHEEVDGVAQGGVVRLPVRFLSGAMRGRFHPGDGQLYVTGMRGWQTSAIRDGGLQRMRYTGEPMRMPIGMSVHADGIRLTFSEPLDRAAAQDPRNYAVERWNYRWTAQYGSDDWSVADPERRGRDAAEVVSATLGEDGRELFLEIADMKPVMQMGVRYNIDAADGSLVSGAVYPTVHRLGAAYLD